MGLPSGGTGATWNTGPAGILGCLAKRNAIWHVGWRSGRSRLHVGLGERRLRQMQLLASAAGMDPCFLYGPFPDSPWCTGRGGKTAVTNCAKRNSN